MPHRASATTLPAPSTARDCTPRDSENVAFHETPSSETTSVPRRWSVPMYCKHTHTRTLPVSERERTSRATVLVGVRCREIRPIRLAGWCLSASGHSTRWQGRWQESTKSTRPRSGSLWECCQFACIAREPRLAEYRQEAQLDVQLGEAADLIDAGAVVQAVQQGAREVGVLRYDVPLTECVGVGVQQPLRGERASVSPAVYVVTVCVCVYVRPERDVRYCWYWGLEQRWQSVAMAHWRRSL